MPSVMWKELTAEDLRAKAAANAIVVLPVASMEQHGPHLPVGVDTFGVIDAVTGGGPAGATTTMVYKVYADGRLGGDLGGSAAQSVILMIIVIALTAIQFRYVEKKVTY